MVAPAWLPKRPPELVLVADWLPKRGAELVTAVEAAGWLPNAVGVEPPPNAEVVVDAACPNAVVPAALEAGADDDELAGWLPKEPKLNPVADVVAAEPKSPPV